MNSRKKYRAIQIIGTQRSGSNLLRLMLNQLDEIVAPHPPHILKTFIPLLPAYGDLGDAYNFKKLIDDVCRLVETNPVPWQGVVLDRDRIYTICKNNSLIELFKVIHEIKAEVFEADIWCCKSMHNVYFADQLEPLDPFYIHLVRDGRDVAASFKKAIVGEKHPYILGVQWKKDQIYSNQLVKNKGSSRAIRIHYEKLIKDPENVIQSVCNLIGISYNSRVLDFYHSRESNVTARSGKMWKNLKKPIIRNNSNKYKKELSHRDIEIFEKVAGSSLIEFGYHIDNNNYKTDQFSPGQLIDFENKNVALKTKIKKNHKSDLQNRSEREKLINEITFRLPK